MDDLRAQVEHTVPGLAIETAQLMEDLIGDLTSVPQPIEIKIFSDDEGTLQKLAPQVAEAISSVSGVVEVKNGITPAGDGWNGGSPWTSGRLRSGAAQPPLADPGARFGGATEELARALALCEPSLVRLQLGGTDMEDVFMAYCQGLVRDRRGK
jgi:hypothetical protein